MLTSQSYQSTHFLKPFSEIVIMYVYIFNPVSQQLYIVLLIKSRVSVCCIKENL